MIKDGLAEPKVPRRLKREGWRDISTAPLAKRYRYNECAFPAEIEGLTTHGMTVIARYCANGTYEDQWTNLTGKVVFQLTHWRPRTFTC